EMAGSQATPTGAESARDMSRTGPSPRKEGGSPMLESRSRHAVRSHALSMVSWGPRAGLIGACLLQIASGAEAADAPVPASSLTVVERSISLERGDWIYWQIDYRLRYEGPAEQVVVPEGLSARVDGWVSNSRVPG